MNHSTPATSPAAANAWRALSSRAVHPSRCAGAQPQVAAIADGLAAVAVPWELATGQSPDERQFELILSTESYDAWLIHWPAGSGLDAHDHGGSAGAFAVVSGVLEEHTVVDSVDVTRRVEAGQSVSFDGAHVHAVRNRADAAATSVHVYAPPLRSMGFYRADNGNVVLERIADVGRSGAVEGQR